MSRQWAILWVILGVLALLALGLYVSQHPTLRPGCAPHRPYATCSISPAPTR